VNLPAHADARPMAKMPGKSKFLDREFLTQESSRLLKKAAQKLLLIRAALVSTPQAKRSKSFLRRFFSKKRLLSC
jgi:hypothetical protein